MYCSKCGKALRPEDRYCPNCGLKAGSDISEELAQTKSNFLNTFLIGLMIFFVIAAVPFVSRRSEERKANSDGYRTDTQVVTRPTLAAADLGTDLDPREATWPNGSVRRKIMVTGTDVMIYDYHQNGTMDREAWVYYDQNGAYAGKRVKEYDTAGNPTDELETMEDGTVWLHILYTNTYDDQGRPLKLCSFNRANQPLTIEEFTYQTDGSYTREFTEYRGPVYEYDFESKPAGDTALWFHSVTEFDSQGKMLLETITMDGGLPVS